MRRTALPTLAVAVAVVATVARSSAAPVAAAECVVIGPATSGASPSFVSHPDECAHATAPASTFKIPHALIALQAGVIDLRIEWPWDGTAYDAAVWRRAHSVESAIRWSVLPVFQETARRLGPARMRAGLAALRYAADGFDGEVSSFWLNGDLVVTPLEQFAFLRRFATGELPIDGPHVAAVRAALAMPPGEVTNATGSHPFRLAWPTPVTVRLKTGNTTVRGERVSWAAGSVAASDREYIVVARVRATGAVDGTAGLDAARRALDAFQDRGWR